MKGLDYSSGRPNLAAAKKAGYGFVVRYLFPPLKGVTVTEAQAIRAAGLGLVVIYESYAGRALEGQAAGAADGKTALAFARAIGFPDSRPIYFAVDFAATAAQQPVINAYLKGAASAIGAARVGVYGSYYVVERCYANKTAQWFWQTRGWSSGKVSTHTHFYQYLNGQAVAGANVDLNESKQDDFGAWEVEVIKPVVTPVVARPVSTAEKKLIDLKIIGPGHDVNGVVSWGAMEWTIYRLLQALGKV